MAFLTYLLCTILIELATGQIAAFNGQGVFNGQGAFNRKGTFNSQNPQFANLFDGRSLASNTPLSKSQRHVAGSNFASNMATAGNGLGVSSVANRNLANAVVATSNIPAANPFTASPSLASNLASTSTNVVAASINSNIAKPNIAKAANFIQSQITRSAANVANPSPSRNIASDMASSQYRLGNSYNSPAQNYNPLTNSNFASNLANRNIASASLPNSWYPNVATSYSQSRVPGSQQYGIHVEADALKIAGNVEVTGSLPFAGTVSFNDRLPTGGVGTVNYACLS